MSPTHENERKTWRSMFGLRERPDEAPTDRPASVGAATRGFLAEQGDHDSSEDLHPTRLDETEATLARALAHDAREANERREAQRIRSGE